MKGVGPSITLLVWLWIHLAELVSSVTIEEEIKADYWQNLGQQTLKATLKLPKTDSVAKNVIFFLGDGMGIPTITAMRIYKGQKKGKRGEEEDLAFDKFPFVSLAKTYALNKMVPDSANTATAYFCGVKANYGTLGVDGRVAQEDCNSSLDKSTHVTSVLQWAQEEGKKTGFVTTTRVTHATPAGLYAHSAHRDWESGSPDARCEDIASQLVHKKPGKDIHVILGGGRQMFLPTSVNDTDGIPGKRNDTRNLLKEWMFRKKEKGLKVKSAFDYESFKDVNPYEVDYLLGLFNSSNLPFVADREDIPQRLPNLVEMTEMAIKILNKGSKGFFLAVEGGRIDSAHHLSSAYKALEEGVEFDAAIQKALEITDPEETLILVTADHSHTMSIAGHYPKRGSNILGLGGVSDVNNLSMTILSYANGPGYKIMTENLTEAQVLHKDYKQDAAYPLNYETHGGEDVAVYATGPMAHLFHGVHDQSYIPYAIGYASCIGPNKELCTSSALSQTIKPHYTICALMLSLVIMCVI